MPNDIAKDPDNIFDDDVIAEIQIKVRRNGSMSTGGDINNLAYAISMLDNAKDAVRQHHARMASGAKIIIPSKDVGLPGERAIDPYVLGSSN